MEQSASVQRMLRDMIAECQSERRASRTAIPPRQIDALAWSIREKALWDALALLTEVPPGRGFRPIMR